MYDCLGFVWLPLSQTVATIRTSRNGNASVYMCPRARINMAPSPCSSYSTALASLFLSRSFFLEKKIGEDKKIFREAVSLFAASRNESRAKVGGWILKPHRLFTCVHATFLERPRSRGTSFRESGFVGESPSRLLVPLCSLALLRFSEGMASGLILASTGFSAYRSPACLHYRSVFWCVQFFYYVLVFDRIFYY